MSHPARTRQRSLALGLILLLAGGSFVAWVYWAKGWNSWWAERRFAQAMELSLGAQQQALRELLHHEPTHAEALWRLFELELGDGQQEMAYLRLQNLIELYPDDPRAWVAMAGALRSAGLLVDAQKTLSRAVAADPTLLEARLQRFDLRLRLGQQGAARRELQRLRELGLGPEQAEFLAQRLQQAKTDDAAPPTTPPRGSGQFWPGKLAQLVGQTLQAAREEDWTATGQLLDQARESYPTTMFAPWLAGVVALNRADLEAAIGHFETALHWAPRSHRVLGLLTRARAQRDGAQATALWLRDLARADPGYELAWVTAAQVYMELRQPAQAEQLLREAMTLPAAGAIPYKQLALLFQQLDRPAEALDLCAQGLQLFPEQAELLQIRAELSLRHAPERAAPALQAWLAVAADSNLARALLAQVLMQANPPAADRARELLGEIAADRPAEQATLRAAGLAQLALGEPGAALASFDRALARQPADVQLQFYRAQALLALGEETTAQQQLQTLLATELNFPERIDALRLLQTLEKETGSE